MKMQAHYFKIGLFVLLCVTVLVVGLISINADAIHGHAILMETYINESVQGLKVGSALMHRGVDIGRVKKITFVPAEYPMDINSPEFDRYGRYVMVVVAVDPDKIHGMGRDPQLFKTMMRNQIKEGLRLKLTYQGITGLVLLQTEYDDPNAPYLKPPWITKYFYVPSMPSTITSFTNAVDSVFQRLERIDFEGLARKLDTSLDVFQQAVGEVQVAHLRDSTLSLIDEIKQTNQQMQTFLKHANGLSQSKLPAALDQFTDTLARIDLLLQESEPDVDRVLNNLKVLSQNLRDLSEMLKDDPASLFLSRPPQRSEVVK